MPGSPGSRATSPGRRVRGGQQRTARQRARRRPGPRAATSAASTEQARSTQATGLATSRAAAGSGGRPPGPGPCSGRRARRAGRTVAGLVRHGGDQVADGVQAVPVGQPRRAPAGAAPAGAGPSAARPALAAPGDDPPGRRYDRRPARRARRPPRRARGPAAARAPARRLPSSSRTTCNGRPARGPVDQQRVERGAPAPGARNAPVSGVRRTPRWAASTWKTTARDAPRPGARRGPPASRSRRRRRRAGAGGRSRRASPSTGRADQHPGGVDGEHLAAVVVLALVVLAALETGLAAAGAADGDADLEQPAQRGPLAELGAERRGVGAVGGDGEQLLERVGGRGAVVVEQPDPVVVAGAGARDAAARRGPRRRTPLSGGASSTAPWRRAPRGAAGGAVGAAGVDGDHPVRAAASAGQRRRARPAASDPVVADEQRGHVAVTAGAP